MEHLDRMVTDEHPEWPGTKPREDLFYIGYWRPADRRYRTRKHPDPLDFVDPSWDPVEREEVLAYLVTGGQVLYTWLGSSTCRFCGLKPCGDRACYEDGTYAWPAGLAHYVREHGLRVPQQFVDHIRLRAQAPVARPDRGG